MSRQKVILVALIAIAATPVLALASPVPDLNEFESGSPVVASDINDNFGALADAIDDNDARVSAIENEAGPIVVRAANTLSIPVLAQSTTILFNNEFEDSDDAYNSGTGVFTCPRPALLQVSYNVFFQNLVNSTRLLVIEGPDEEYEVARELATSTPMNLSAALAIRCEAEGDEWLFRAACDQSGGCLTEAQSGTRTFSHLSVVEVR